MAEAQGEQLFSQFADEGALEKQQAKILSIFSNIKKGINELNGLGVDLKAAKTIKEVDKTTAAYNATIKETNKFINEYYSTQAKVEIQKQKEYAALKQQQSALKDFNKEQQLRLKLANSVEADAGGGASLKTLTIQYEKATLILSKLNATQRDTARATGLQKFAEDTKKKIAELNQKVGNFRDNVGNYANSLGGLFAKVADEISKLKAKQDEITQRTVVQGFVSPKDKQDLDNTTNALNELNNVMAISQKTGQSFQSTVRQIGFQFSNLQASGNQSEEFLNDFKKGAAEAKDHAQDLKDEIKALASDTRGLDLVSGAIQTIAGGFQTAVGAAALFGGENKDTQKTLTKLVAVQQVANGIKEVGTQLTKHGTAANIAYNFVLKETQILFGAGTGAAAKFGAALKLTGIGLLITGIGFLISKMDIFGDSTETAADRTKSFEDALDDLNATITDTVTLLSEGSNKGDVLFFKALIAEAEAAGASQEKLFDLRKKLAAKERDISNEQFDALTKKAEAENFNYSESVKGQDALINATQYYLERTKDANGELEKLQKEKIDILRLGGGSSDTEEIDKQIEGQKKLRDNAKKFYEEYSQAGINAVDKQEDLDNLIIQNNTRIIEAEKKAAFELFKYRQQLIIDQNKAYASDDSDVSFQTRISAAKMAADYEIELVIRTAKEELSQKDLAASKIKQIEEQRANDIRDIEFKLQSDITNIQVNAIQKSKDLTKTILNNYKEQKAEELKLKTEEQQKAYDKEQNQLDAIREQDIQRAQTSFNAGLLTLQEYNDKKAKIDVDYQKKTLQHQITFYEAQRDLLKASGEDTTALTAAIEKAKSDLGDLKIIVKTEDKQKLDDFKKTELEFADQLKQKYIDLGATIQQAFVSLIDNTYEKRKNQIQDQIDDIDRLKEEEIKGVDKSTDSEERKAAKIANIEAVAQQKKEALQRRQRQIDHQKAIFDRNAKIFDIVTEAIKDVAKIKSSAAVAYGQVLATTGNQGQARQIQASILAQIIPTVAAAGIAAASLLAQEIPKYGGGVDSSPETDAVIAERGREMRVDPDGKMRLYEKPSFVHLSRGTKILANKATEDILAASQTNVANKFIVLFNNKEEDRKDEEILRELKQLNSKPPLVIINQSGIESTPYYNYHMKR